MVDEGGEMENEELFEHRGKITSDGEMDFDNFLGSTVPIVFPFDQRPPTLRKLRPETPSAHVWSCQQIIG